MTNLPNCSLLPKNLPSLATIEAELLRRKRNKFATLFPDEGQYRRELYAKHLEFMAAGAAYPERLFMAGNRTGKTEVAAYETTAHLTGLYPHWWDERFKRFSHPIEAWAGGIDNLCTRDVIQEKLLGKPGEWGTGMIPGDCILHIAKRQGLADAVDTIYVRHKTGGRSVLGLKSYEQGRESWQGTAKHLVWLDEEPPEDVYVEALMRTATTGGSMLVTFTPLLGLSDVVKGFIEADELARLVKFFIQATWDDVPHLTEQAKTALYASIPVYQREARSKGVPTLGIGAIYPLAESDITVPRFELPKHWPRWYGMDVGWNRTAAIWFALDRETDRMYLYHEHYRGQAEPVIHAAGIKAPGAWIPGVIDPSCIGSNQVDGRNLLDMYRTEGLDLQTAENAVESGIFEVWQALSSGKLKVFSDLAAWLGEFRKYHRDQKGKVVKADDHLMDATRYGVVSGRTRAKTEPVKKTHQPGNGGTTTGWMG